MFPDSDICTGGWWSSLTSNILARKGDSGALSLTHGHEGSHRAASPSRGRAPHLRHSPDPGSAGGAERAKNLLRKVRLEYRYRKRCGSIWPLQNRFFHTCHSFPDSVGVSDSDTRGPGIMTREDRFDATPVDGKRTETGRLKRWGDEGVLLLLADSTNVESLGTTPSERTVEAGLDEVFSKAPGRVILATFASNVSRVQQIINVSRRHQRQVGTVGRSMINNVKISMKLGYLDVKPDELLSAREMEELPASHVTIVATGSQGEPTSAMVRMSMGDHRQLTLRKGDTVVLSAVPIPGNEELFNRTVDNLYRQGAKVVYHELADSVHVSGHGGRADYQHMLELVRPRYFVPVHGEYRHLVLHGELAVETGVPEANVFVIEDGQVLEFGRFDSESDVTQARMGEHVNAAHVFVDGLGVGDIGTVVLRDRGHLGSDGFMVCIVALDEFDGSILYGPEIITRGFVYVRDNEGLLKRAADTVRNEIKPNTPSSVLSRKIRNELSAFCHREMGRRPMILPVVIEV